MKIEYRHLRWLSLIWDTKLTTKAKVTAAALADHMNANHNIAWPSEARIAAMTSQASRTVIRAIQELEEAGWIVKDPGGINKGTNRYQPVFPPAIEQQLMTQSQNTGDTQSLAGDTESPARVPHSHPNQSNESVHNNQRGKTQFVQKDKKRKNPSPPNSEQRPASHQPFKEPAKLTAKQKQAAQADLDNKAKQIAERQSRDIKRKQIAACRQPANLAKLCRHYGWGDPPSGMDFTEAKSWATKQANAKS